MHARSPILVLATACVVTFANLPAQEASTVIESAFGLSSRGGALGGGGAHYGATFDREGMVFTPALGKQAPKAYPTRFRMTEITREGATICINGGPRPKLRDTTAVYDHGGGVVERYHLRAAGVEVTYTFEKKPEGTGDLRVRLAIEGELRPDGRTENDEVALHDADHGGITVGAVTGVDAAGRRAKGTTRIVDGALELTLPAAFVDGAAYPMVLDPLIGTDFGIGSNSSNDHFADVAFGVGSNLYLAVWQRNFGGLNVEIRGQFFSRTGGKVGGLIQFTNSSRISLSPAVGYVRKTNRYLVAWQHAQSLNGNWDIVCRSVNPSNGSMSAVVPIANTQASELNVDIGSDRQDKDDEAVVVWAQAGTGIRAKQVTVPANGNPITANLTNAVSSNGKDRRPAISKSGGRLGKLLVVFERQTGSRWDIRARIVDKDAVPRGAEKGLTGSIYDETRPSVDGDGEFFMAAWQRQEATTSTNHDIRGRMLRLDNNVIQYVTPPLTLEGGIRDNETEPDVGFLLEKFAVVWTDVNGTNKRTIGLKMFHKQTGALCDPTLGMNGPHSNNVAAVIAPRYAGGGPSDEAFVAFTSQDPATSFRGNLRGQLIEAIGDGGAVSNLGGGCGLGGLLSAKNACAIANPSFWLELNGAAPSATLGLLNLSPPAPPFVTCGACQISNPSILIPKAISNGNSTFRIPIPCDPELVDVKLHWQYFVLASGTTPCVAADGVSFSNRLETTIGR